MNFIKQFECKELNICDEMISFFNRNQEFHRIGTTNKGVDILIKDSTDLTIKLNEIEKNNELVKYVNFLHQCTKEYINEFSYCNHYAPWGIVEDINIQHYAPNQGYFQWHTERSSANSKNSARHLAFITYLNDVDDGGETEFFYQKIKVTPRKGLTVIFPADWTYTHRGITSKTQYKYIVTGWFSYI